MGIFSGNKNPNGDMSRKNCGKNSKTVGQSRTADKYAEKQARQQEAARRERERHERGR